MTEWGSDGVRKKRKGEKKKASRHAASRHAAKRRRRSLRYSVSNRLAMLTILASAPSWTAMVPPGLREAPP